MTIVKAWLLDTSTSARYPIGEFSIDVAKNEPLKAAAKKAYSAAKASLGKLDLVHQYVILVSSSEREEHYPLRLFRK